MKIEKEKLYGLFEALTEGDSEARSLRRLGIFEGYIPDIVSHLVDKCAYRLYLKPLDITKVDKPMNVDGSVNVDIDYFRKNIFIEKNIDSYIQLKDLIKEYKSIFEDFDVEVDPYKSCRSYITLKYKKKNSMKESNKPDYYYFNNKEELIEDYTTKQVDQLLQYPPYDDCFISMMPDAHPGKITPVGFTCYINNLDKVMPMAIGGDIGCGVTVVNIGNLPKKFDPKSLDVFIRDNIPSGFNSYTNVSDISEKALYKYNDLFDRLNIGTKDLDLYRRGLLDIGTLGGGNHFIEIGQGEHTYLTVHSGSRYLGNAITEKYLDIAQMQTKLSYDKEVPRELSWLSEKWVEKYISDVEILSEYARLNRMEIINKILKFLKIKNYNIVFDAPHNTIVRYNNGESNMITKGAVFLNFNHKATSSNFSFSRVCALPLNMRDGVAIGQITADPLWNYCIPHGTGRKYSRTETKNHTTVTVFKKIMNGIYCSCINYSTLDESPVAYKDSNIVLDIMKEHGFEIYDIAKPIYNFKAGWRKR